MAQEWKKLTIRLRPETHVMMNKLSKAEPSVVIRGMIERLVGIMIEQKYLEERVQSNLSIEKGDQDGR